MFRNGWCGRAKEQDHHDKTDSPRRTRQRHRPARLRGAPRAGATATMGGAEGRERGRRPATPGFAAAVVYVADFRLDAQAQEAGSDALECPRLLHLPGESRDAAEQAAKIVNHGTVADRRPESGGDHPGGCCPERRCRRRVGSFAAASPQASEGNTMRRAVVGFGAGAPKMEVQVAVSDLADQPGCPSSFSAPTRTRNGGPGGLLTRNPDVVAAKFVLEKGAPNGTRRATGADHRRQARRAAGQGARARGGVEPLRQGWGTAMFMDRTDAARRLETRWPRTGARTRSCWRFRAARCRWRR